MRAAEASQFARKFDDDDDGSSALLKPQWLQRPSGSGISNQFRSADQFRGRGGRKFGGDDRRPRRVGEGLSSKGSSLSPNSDFPPLAPFYRSHSTGSLTPADIPSASSRLLSASKEEKSFSINRECDFPTLATAAAVEQSQPARMHKSKSATALPQAISPSSDLLIKAAHHTTLAALVGGPSPSAASPAASSAQPAPVPGSDSLPAAAAHKQTHKKKPSFSDKVSFSEVAATEKAASNKDKFQQAMANSRAELQRFKSLVPSKPVHPSLSNRSSIRPLQPKARPKMPAATATVLKPTPDLVPPTSPATMRKATSAPVLPMSTNLPRSPPNPSPLSTVWSTSSSSSSSSSSHTPSSGPSSPPRPALLSSSQSARTLPQASSSSSGGADGGAARQPFALPSSRFPFANGSLLVSPRRRDSSPAASLSSSASSSAAASPLTSPRRGSTPVATALVQQESDMMNFGVVYSSSAPLSPRMPSTATVNGGSNVASSAKSSKKPLRNSGSAAAPSSSKPLTTNGKQRRRSVKSNNAGRRRSLAPEDDATHEPQPATTAASNGHAAPGGQWAANGFAAGSVYEHFASNNNSDGSSSGSSSDDDLNQEPEYDRVNDEQIMMIATGMTSITAASIAGVQLQPHLPTEDEDEQASANGAVGDGGVSRPLNDEFCPFSWEMRADGEEWSEWSEDAVRSFMKKELGYDAPAGLEGDGLSGEEDEQGLTEEEIRLAKQQIERANLQQLLEKKKQGLSESLKNWQPPTSSPASPSAGSALAPSSSSSSSSASSSSLPSSASTSATSPTLLRPATSLSASASTTTATASSGGRRGHKQPLRSSSGPSSSQLHGRRHHHHHSLQQVADLIDSDSDESEGEEEVHGFHGIVFG